MPKKEKRGKIVREKMGQILDMPLDMIKDYSRMTVLGNESVLIENYKGIVEYDEELIRLNNNICLYGSKLSIEEITDDEILVTGKIKSIEFGQ